MKNVKLMTVATLAALSLSTVGGLITQADTVDYDSNGVVEFIPQNQLTQLIQTQRTQLIQLIRLIQQVPSQEQTVRCRLIMLHH